MRFFLKLLAKRREAKRQISEDAEKAKAHRTAQITKHVTDATRAIAEIGGRPVAWTNTDEKSTFGAFYFFRGKKLYAAKVMHGGGLTIQPL